LAKNEVNLTVITLASLLPIIIRFEGTHYRVQMLLFDCVCCYIGIILSKWNCEMAAAIKRGWYVVYLPALISLPLFMLVSLINEYHISANARHNAINELNYKAKYLSQALNYVNENKLPLIKSDFDRLVDNLTSNDLSHVSVFSTDGTLIADNLASGYSITNTPNEIDQPEIAQAIKDGRGTINRFNPVISQKMSYVAINLQGYILRVGINDKFEKQEITHQRINYLPTFIVLFLLTSIGGFFFITWLNNRLKIRYQLLKQQVQAQTSELLLLQEFGTLLTLSKSFLDIEQVLGKFSQMLLYHDAGRISVIRSSRNLAEIKMAWGQKDWIELGHYPLDDCWALRKGYIHPQGPYDKLIQCTHDIQALADINTICIPLVAQGETLGVMHIKRENPHDEFSDNDRQMATSLAEPVALAIANLQLRDNLRNQAIKDSLTGLFNRRYFSETAEKELARAIKQSSPMAILMIDIDFFKKLNDSFGHDAGDAALKTFGALLAKLTLTEHVACRMGGEEFVILLSDTTTTKAVEFANNLRIKIKELKISNNGMNVGPITASIGVAMFDNDSKDINDLVKLADQALYRAKENGRDQVVLSEPLCVVE